MSKAVIKVEINAQCAISGLSFLSWSQSLEWVEVDGSKMALRDKDAGSDIYQLLRTKRRNRCKLDREATWY